LEQIRPPPALARRVREAFVPIFPPLRERDRVVLALRGKEQSRSFLNEPEIQKAIESVCAEIGATLQGERQSMCVIGEPGLADR
jgi:hypothetical protein